MRVIGFSFNKISVERKPVLDKGIKVNTNIDISEIKELDNKILKTKEILLGIKFAYVVNYSPDFAKVELSGEVILAVEQKLAKETLNQWKDKKMPENFKIFLFNMVLMKSNLKALQLEEEVNIPLHFPLPSLKKPEEEK